MSPAPVVVEEVTFWDRRTDADRVREVTVQHTGQPPARRAAIARALQRDLLSVFGYAATDAPPLTALGVLPPRPRVNAAQTSGARNTALAEIQWTGRDGTGPARVFLGAHAEKYAGYLTFRTTTTTTEETS